MATATESRIGLYIVAAAVAATVLAPLLALAYFATADGLEELDVGTVAAWAEPGRQLAGRLVTFASPDRVYATYTQILALLFPAIALTGFETRSRRRDAGTRPERWGWRIGLAGYCLFGVGLLVVAALLIPGDTGNPVVDMAFIGAMFPGLLLGLIGSTVLGVAFIRSGYEPRLTAWLLALSFPLWILGSFVLGHNGLGLVPLFIAWAATGRRWRAEPAPTELAASERARW